MQKHTTLRIKHSSSLTLQLIQPPTPFKHRKGCEGKSDQTGNNKIPQKHFK